MPPICLCRCRSKVRKGCSGQRYAKKNSNIWSEKKIAKKQNEIKRNFLFVSSLVRLRLGLGLGLRMRMRLQPRLVLCWPSINFSVSIFFCVHIALLIQAQYSHSEYHHDVFTLENLWNTSYFHIITHTFQRNVQRAMCHNIHDPSTIYTYTIQYYSVQFSFLFPVFGFNSNLV